MRVLSRLLYGVFIFCQLNSAEYVYRCECKTECLSSEINVRIKCGTYFWCCTTESDKDVGQAERALANSSSYNSNKKMKLNITDNSRLAKTIPKRIVGFNGSVDRNNEKRKNQQTFIPVESSKLSSRILFSNSQPNVPTPVLKLSKHQKQMWLLRSSTNREHIFEDGKTRFNNNRYTKNQDSSAVDNTMINRQQSRHRLMNRYNPRRSFPYIPDIEQSDRGIPFGDEHFNLNHRRHMKTFEIPDLPFRPEMHNPYGESRDFEDFDFDMIRGQFHPDIKENDFMDDRERFIQNNLQFVSPGRHIIPPKIYADNERLVIESQYPDRKEMLKFPLRDFNIGLL